MGMGMGVPGVTGMGMPMGGNNTGMGMGMGMGVMPEYNNNLAGLGGGAPMDGLTTQMGGLMSNAQGNGASVGPAEITAYDANGILVKFKLTKGAQPNMTQVTATITNSQPHDALSFNFQAAVPKYCKIQLGQASSQVVPANNSGAITQSIKLINTQFGQSPSRILMRIVCTLNNQPFQDQKPVDLPTGY
eukprot:c19140_g1_i2.p1 GENE.c19140_g1_i2~~c19140_g1_i2.p1  ORF type:complete len:189 (+),score=38.11 c19140_g1_i2:3-569(+)